MLIVYVIESGECLGTFSAWSVAQVYRVKLLRDRKVTRE